MSMSFDKKQQKFLEKQIWHIFSLVYNKIVKRGITEKNIQWTACICVFAISLVELHSHLIISLQKLMSQDSQRQPYCSKEIIFKSFYLFIPIDVMYWVDFVLF